MKSKSRKAHIVGVGESIYTKWGGIQDKTQFQLTAETIATALTDAGIAVAEADGLTSFSNDANDAPLMAVTLGLKQLRYSAMVWGGGGGGSAGSVAQACAAVESGQAEVVVAYRGLCQGQGRRFGRFGAGRIHGNFVHPYGLFAPAQMLALLVQRYFHETGGDPDSLVEIALNGRANANRNPRAVMRDRELTREQYFASRWIAEPLRLFDCCLETDGAAAVVVTTAERAADLDADSVEVAAAVHGSGPGWGSGPLGSHNMPDEDYATSNSKLLAQDLFNRADMTPSDINVAQFYDHFSGLVLMALEDYGFCGRGEAPDFVKSGAIRADGSLPINTSGGQLSEAYVHGMNLVIEGVRQLRGVSTTQIADAQTCLVTGGLGVSPTSALILTR